MKEDRVYVKVSVVSHQSISHECQILHVLLSISLTLTSLTLTLGECAVQITSAN